MIQSHIDENEKKLLNFVRFINNKEFVMIQLKLNEHSLLANEE